MEATSGIIGEQYIRNDDYVLAESDKDEKLVNMKIWLQPKRSRELLQKAVS